MAHEYIQILQTFIYRQSYPKDYLIKPFYQAISQYILIYNPMENNQQ